MSRAGASDPSDDEPAAHAGREPSARPDGGQSSRPNDEQSSPGPSAAFRAGARDVLPALPANIPFGIIAGVATVGVGIDPAQAVAFAALLFAGAAQIAAVELVGENAPVVIVVLTALVVNLRYVMYSASLGAYFRDASARWKVVVAYFIVDVTYAIPIAEFESGTDLDPATDGRWYYLGAALPLWTTWVTSSVVGIVFGARVPASWQLDFAIPLLFLGLLFPALNDAPSYLAAGAAGVLAVAGAGLPFDLGILAAAFGGILSGIVVDRWDDSADDEEVTA
ncbi:AzlC family ABC transporter permease [Halorussus litoreus]|uniref:AzlC family ABC transporter permease n=1 Tax=Halorussus litoreus TaxID=1710536 RepID=UPI000E263AE0|nr:AzlC family ABC transporter permease [Halorussus litoreus]